MIRNFIERGKKEKLLISIEKLIDEIDGESYFYKQPKKVKKLNKKLIKTQEYLYHKIKQFDYEKKKNLTNL